MKKNVVFIKVQKCSSTSVRVLIENFAHSNNLKLILMKKDAGGGWHRTRDYNMDHLWAINNPPYNISARHHAYDEIYFERLIDDPVYITMIRDPLDRAISAFHSDMVRPLPHERNMEFEEWWGHHLNNLNLPPVKLSLHAEIINNFIAYMLGFDNLNEITEENLKKRYSFIGLTEHFDYSIKKMEELLQWKFPDPPYPYIRQGTPGIVNRIRENLSPQFINDFKEKNQLDYKIYEITKKLF